MIESYEDEATNLKANLSSLSGFFAKNSLTTFTGDNGKEIIKTIKDYKTCSGRVNDCRQELSELSLIDVHGNIDSSNLK